MKGFCPIHGDVHLVTGRYVNGSAVHIPRDANRTRIDPDKRFGGVGLQIKLGAQRFDDGRRRVNNRHLDRRFG